MTTPAKRPQWITSAGLLALANAGCDQAGTTFLAEDLAGWVKGTLTATQRKDVTWRLISLAFITHRAVNAGPTGRSVEYTLTAAGAEAIKAASAGQVRKSGPKGHRKASPLPADSIAAKLWKLLRMRRVLESDSAAQTLADAGSDDFGRMQATVRKYLKRWAAAGALEIATRRVGAKGCSNGCKRYVLSEDWMNKPEPPPWRQIARNAAQEARS